MRSDMPVEVHQHETGELKEAGVDRAPPTGIGPGHTRNDIVTEPIGPAPLGQPIHDGRADAGVDGPAGENHAPGHGGLAVLLHEGNRCECGHSGLADGEQVYVPAELGEHVAHVVDVIVEIERSGRERNIARVEPVGDEDLMVGEQKSRPCREEGSRSARTWAPRAGCGGLSRRGWGQCGA